MNGVIYCENCLAARMEGVQPNVAPAGAGFAPVVPGCPYKLRAARTPRWPAFSPASSLSAWGRFIPGNNAKGLAHLVIFSPCSSGVSSPPTLVILLQLSAWLSLSSYVYQIIDSVRTARALQAGQPAPDPFGLAEALSAPVKRSTVQRAHRRHCTHRPGCDLSCCTRWASGTSARTASGHWCLSASALVLLSAAWA